MNCTKVHHDVILSTEDLIAALVTAWNRAWGHVLRLHVAHQGCFAGEWALLVAFCPFADQGRW